LLRFSRIKKYKMFRLALIFTALFGAFVSAQRESDLSDISAAAKAYKSAGLAYQAAAASTGAASAAATGGSVVDYTTGQSVSFLRKGAML
ncbi:unnamed protein product, partial [Amoebophrya sp. A120]